MANRPFYPCIKGNIYTLRWPTKLFMGLFCKTRSAWDISPDGIHKLHYKFWRGKIYVVDEEWEHVQKKIEGGTCHMLIVDEIEPTEKNNG